MMTSRRLLLAGTILLASCAVLAAPKRPAFGGVLPRYGMLVYSDLCIDADSGEYGGQRITLQRFSEVDTVLYEYTAGGLSWPLVATEVTIDPRGRQFYFTVQPRDEAERTISGKLADGGKTLVLDGGYCGDPALPMRLALVKNFGRKAGACRPCPEPQQPPHTIPAPEVEPDQSAPLMTPQKSSGAPL